MNYDVIRKLMTQLNEAVAETKTLYDITETEMLVLTHVIIEASSMGLSPKLTARILKAAAHFIETSSDITDKCFKE